MQPGVKYWNQKQPTRIGRASRLARAGVIHHELCRQDLQTSRYTHHSPAFSSIFVCLHLLRLDYRGMSKPIRDALCRSANRTIRWANPAPKQNTPLTPARQDSLNDLVLVHIRIRKTRLRIAKLGRPTRDCASLPRGGRWEREFVSALSWF